MTKQQLDNLFITSYEKLELVCKKNIKKDKQYLIPEIMSELYLALHDKQDKITFNSIDKFVTYCTLWLWNNIKFPRTAVNNLINNKKNKKDRKINDTNHDNIEIITTNIVDDSISEEEQLEYEYEIQEKINKLYANVSKLSQEEQILFGLYFIRGYSSGAKLSKHLGISTSSCINMVRELKNKLKNDIY